MKNLLTIGLALALHSLFFSACRTDSPVETPGDRTQYIPSDSARAHFLIEAADFAVEYLYQIASRETASVIIPDSAVNRFLIPLALLYDAREMIPLLDTLILQREIHKQGVTCLRLSIAADTSFPWVRNARKGIEPVGEPTVDSLFSRYGIRFAPHSYIGFSGQVRLETIQPPLNNRPLAKALTSVPGVVSANPAVYYSFTSKLDVSPGDLETTVDFYLGYGDCPAGCFGYDRWTFSVGRTDSISYRGYEHM